MARFNRDDKGDLFDEKGNRVILNPPNQMVFDEEGNVISPEDLHKSKIIDEDGSELSPEEEKKMYLDMVKNFDPRNFIDELSNNATRALKILLAMQSNNSPLKKGGEGIAFMADVLILSTRNMFTAGENTLFDVLSAKVSSNPEDSSYTIYAKDFIPLLPQKDRPYANRILQEATESIKVKNAISVKINGTDKHIAVPWFNALMYTDTEKVDAYYEDDYISFAPTDIFKMLLISSTVAHGAHYKISLSAQFTGYTRKLFYFFESRKKYKEYPTAQQGVFSISLEELQYLLDYPESYRPVDVKRTILQRAKKNFDNANGIDFTFDYEDKKIGKRIVGFLFKIQDIKPVIAIENKSEHEQKEIEYDKERDTAYTMLSSIGLNEKECEDVYKKYKKQKRDVAFLISAIASVSASTNINSKCAVLCHIMDNGLNNNIDTNNKNTKGKISEKKNKFTNVHQRNYDYDELEKTLLNSDPV